MVFRHVPLVTMERGEGLTPPSLGFQCEPEVCEHEGSVSRVGAIFWCCGGR